MENQDQLPTDEYSQEFQEEAAEAASDILGRFISRLSGSLIHEEDVEFEGKEYKILVDKRELGGIFYYEQLHYLKWAVEDTMKYYEMRGWHNNKVHELKKQMLREQEQGRKSEQALIKRKNNGYVYFLKKESTGFIKIGRTGDLESRVKLLKTSYGDDVSVVHFIFCEDCIISEKQYHHKYRDFRRYGEWFELAPDLINEIKNTTK